MFGDHHHVAGMPTGLGNAFQNGRHVADRDPFGKQVLQHPLHAAERNLGRNHFADQLLMFFVQFVQELLGFGVGQKFRHVVLDHFRQMGGDHGRRIDDGIAAEQRLFPVGLLDPHGRKPERGFGRLFTGKRDFLAAGVHDQQHVGPEIAGPGNDFLDPDAIVVGGKLHVVLDAHRRHDETDIGSHLAPERLDLVGQFLAVLGRRDQRQQAVSQLQPEIIDT